MKKRLLIFLIILILLFGLAYFYPYLNGEKEIFPVKYEKEKCFVDRIIDGDTLVCNNETIRLLGIDTPEKGEKYFQEAKDYLSFVDKKEIEILRDWDDLGKYKRKLRYVFYGDRLINVEIVEQGLAIAFMTENLIYEDKIFSAEEIAKKNCLGLWEDGC
jgi:micrococcal nuclease